MKILREEEEFDEFRHSEFIDDVLVGFHKDGLGDEYCWVRVEKSTKKGYSGILLNEPNQDFGVHAGDVIEMYFAISTNHERNLIANLI